MKQTFDVLGRYKYPKLKLCKPNFEGQGFLSAAKDIKMTRRFSGYDEITFEIPSRLSGNKTPLYDNILGGKIIHASPYGFFKIRDVSYSNDGSVETKKVSCVSQEVDISKNKIGRFEQTAKLFNPINKSDPSTIIGFFLQQNPNWSITNVSSDLWNVSRTFDVQNTDWYNFLMNEVSKKFKCFFLFDIDQNTFECLSPKQAIKRTNIIADYDNLLKNIDVSCDTESIYTALNCNGAEYLDIRSVNPLGTNIIYNFKYFKSTEWISKNLVAKISTWENLVQKNKPLYQKTLLSISEKLVSLTDAETELTEIQSKIKASEQAMAIALSSNDDKRYAELALEKNEHVKKESDKKSAIDTLKSIITKLENEKTLINKEVGFEKNFTTDEYNELQRIIFVDNYKNDGFKKTSTMSPAEVQAESQSLYNFSTQILEEICVPKMYFKGQLINFLFLKEYEKFAEQIDVGKQILIQLNKNIRTPVVVLSIEIDFDDPNNFQLEFSNRPQLDNGAFTFSDIFKEVSYSASSFSWDKTLLGEPVKSGKFEEITNFINGNFDAAHNALLTATGIDISFDGSGLHGRKTDESGKLDPRELWAISNMIAISNDNFNTPPKVAIGGFKLPNSDIEVYGINAELLAGKLIVGNQFIFEAQDGSFKFDSTGAKLINANFEVTDLNDLRKITINQSIGIEIKSRKTRSDSFERVLFFDMDGNAVFKGTITAQKGSIGGIRIGEDGIYNDNNGDYWKANGSGKFGLLTYTLNSATFDGNIYAKNLNNSLGSIPPSCYGYNTINGACTVDNTIPESKLTSEYRDKVTRSIAEVKIYADSTFATSAVLSSFKKVDGYNTVESLAGFQSFVNNNYSSVDLFSNFRNEISGRITDSIASFRAEANSNYAKTSQMSRHETRLASVETLANKTSASVSLVVQSSYGRDQINTASIVAAINSSGSSVSISADKINMNGTTKFVKPSDLTSSGSTVIDGGRIKTGTISADRIDAQFISTWFSQSGEMLITKKLILANGFYSGLRTPLFVGSKQVKVKFIGTQAVLGFD